MLSNPYLQNRKPFYLLIFLAVLFFLVGIRIFFLQIVTFTEHQETAENIRARIIPSLAPRGIIFDRNKVVLATSRPYFSLYLLQEQMSNPESTYKLLKRYELVKDSQWQKIIQARSIKDIQPVLLRDNMPVKLVALIREQEFIHPELAIAVRHIRYYPQDKTAAHVLGHIGEITLKQLVNKTYTGYRVGDIIGLAGIEKIYDSILRGINGGQQIEVNALGQPIRRLGEIEDIPGNDIQLTLDLRLQKKSAELLEQFKGAVVILDPNSGEVLALYSNPSFDPNLFTTPISTEEWKKLTAQANPMQNRALTAYPPGSTFKISNFFSALQNLSIDLKRSFFCKGYVQYGNRIALCWESKGHGKIDFFHGLVNSCNTVFYEIGMELSGNAMAQTARQFLLGSKTQIDLPDEAPGFVPDENWKFKRFGQAWYPGDSMNMGIGQGWVQITPLQLALATSGIASSQNIFYQPHLLKKTYLNKPKLSQAFQKKIISRLSAEQQNIETLKTALREVVKTGTGRNALVDEIEIAGKTGTAEDPPRVQPHAWFTSFAPYQKPELVITVFLEQGGHGGNHAAYVARELYLYWLKLKKEKESAQ